MIFCSYTELPCKSTQGGDSLMQMNYDHPVLGKIQYEESFWTGKRGITVNGVPAQKEKKNVYWVTPADGIPVSLQVKGSYLTGVKILFGEESLTITPAPKWYEIAASVFMIVFLLAWGNSPILCSIIPIVGGALGGGIVGAMSVVNLALMKARREAWQKLLVFLGIFALTFAVCFALAFVLILLLV